VTPLLFRDTEYTAPLDVSLGAQMCRRMAPRWRTTAGSLAEGHGAHQHRAYARRFQRDEEQAAEAVSRGLRARGPSTRYSMT
jgi:hypothetical protein